jgi:hypothetical protein
MIWFSRGACLKRQLRHGTRRPDRRPSGVRPPLGLTLILIGGVLAAPAWAETAVQRERYAVLGRFAGLVVACEVASEAEAAEMIDKLSANFDRPWPKADADRFEAARAAGRAARCPRDLRDAVAKGWANYRDAQ